MTSEATGEVEVDDGVLVLKRIHVGYHLRLDPDADREKVERAFDHHMPRCPVCRSIALRWRSQRRSRCSTRKTAEGPVAGALEKVAGRRDYTSLAFRHLRWIPLNSRSKSRTASAGVSSPRATRANI